MKKILVILASGIGNSILFGPTLKQLNLNDYEIDVFAYKKQFAEPFVGSNLVDNIIYFEGFKTLFQLRKNNYDISITAFPSNKWQFNVFAFIVGAKKRITHSYNCAKIKTLSFLQNTKVLADETLHDVDQNIRLLSLLDIPAPKDKSLFFEVDKENEKYANEFIKENKLENKILIGIHPGSGPILYKRTPKEHFIKKINELKAKNKFVLIFGGPEEKDVKNDLKQELGENSLIVDTSLKNTASLIKRCGYFVTNDTGLMHVAVAMKKPKVIAFFYGTNPVRARPYSNSAETIILRESIHKYPFWSTKV